jgi:hypothetical protein
MIPHANVTINTVKPVYKEHSKEHENVPFIYRLKLHALLINGKIIIQKILN